MRCIPRTHPAGLTSQGFAAPPHIFLPSVSPRHAAASDQLLDCIVPRSLALVLLRPPCPLVTSLPAPASARLPTLSPSSRFSVQHAAVRPPSVFLSPIVVRQHPTDSLPPQTALRLWSCNSHQGVRAWTRGALAGGAGRNPTHAQAQPALTSPCAAASRCGACRRPRPPASRASCPPACAAKGRVCDCVSRCLSRGRHGCRSTASACLGPAASWPQMPPRANWPGPSLTMGPPRAGPAPPCAHRPASAAPSA